MREYMGIRLDITIRRQRVAADTMVRRNLSRSRLQILRRHKYLQDRHWIRMRMDLTV